ncbi:MAG: DUF2846 domain-containing protein [Candidatus Acidiferrum sp.]
MSSNPEASIRKYICAFLLTFFIAAWPVRAQDQAAAGCGPSQVLFDVKTDDTKHPEGQSENGKALVYFFVDYITAPTMRVGVDGSWVGANEGKSYFYFTVEPGEHNVCTEWQSSTFKKSSERIGEALHLTVETGKTYYLRLNFSYQRMNLELTDIAEAHFLMGSSLYSTSKLKKK